MPGLDMMTALFALSNALRMAAYFPQMVAVWRDPRGADAVSVWAWVLFATANTTTVAYAALTLEDMMLTVIFALNALCCIAIVIFPLWKRIQHPTPRAAA